MPYCGVMQDLYIINRMVLRDPVYLRRRGQSSESSDGGAEVAGLSELETTRIPFGVLRLYG